MVIIYFNYRWFGPSLSYIRIVLVNQFYLLLISLWQKFITLLSAIFSVPNDHSLVLYMYIYKDLEKNKGVIKLLNSTSKFISRWLSGDSGCSGSYPSNRNKKLGKKARMSAIRGKKRVLGSNVSYRFFNLAHSIFFLFIEEHRTANIFQFLVIPIFFPYYFDKRKFI